MKRVKRRYLAVQLDSETLPSEREFMDAVWASVTKLYGEVGASMMGLVLISFDKVHKIFVIRCSLASLLVARASLAAVTAVAGKTASMQVLYISGTLKALHASIA